MAKNKGKKDTKSRADQARSALDELGGVVSRLRDQLEELRPASGDAVQGLRDDVAALERRVAALEAGRPTAPTAVKSAAAKPAAKKAAKKASAAKKGAKKAAKPAGSRKPTLVTPPSSAIPPE